MKRKLILRWAFLFGVTEGITDFFEFVKIKMTASCILDYKYLT